MEWTIVAFVVLLVLGIFIPVHPHDPFAAQYGCLSNVKQSALGLVMYANDENDRYPPRDAWVDAIYPYTKDKSIFHCPSVPKGAFGYAFNGALSCAKTPKDPEAMPMVYDSVDPIRNASDLCTSLPVPGRHGHQDSGGRNNVAYADGHAKGVPARSVVH